MAVNYYRIGQRVKAIRKLKKMSQAELAETVELSVNYISCIETGKRHASLDALIRIADELGVSVDNLLYGNQGNDVGAYLVEVSELLSDCDRYERSMIFEMALATKKSIRANRWLKSSGEK